MSGPVGSILRWYFLAAIVFAIATLWIREYWAVSAFQVAISGAAFLICIGTSLGRIRIRWHPVFALVFVAAALPWMQIAAGSTTAPYLTVDAGLYWIAAAAVALTAYALTLCRGPESLLHPMMYGGVAICLLSTLQLFTSAGLVFWLFPSGYDSLVLGPFVYRNNYAAFVELLLPALVLKAAAGSNHRTVHAALAAMMIASVFASGSRAGVALVILETTAVLYLARAKRPQGAVPGRSIAALGLLTAGATLVVGYEFIWQRFLNDEAFATRGDLLASTWRMFLDRPWFGFGAGTWPAVYPAYATVDAGAVANHAHNEWAQWAAEGGLPMLFILGVIALWTIRPAISSVWGIGLLAVFLHALVDYPFLRMGLAAWHFAFVGLLASFEFRHRTHTPVRTLRVPAGFAFRTAAVAACLIFLSGAYSSVQGARADAAYRAGGIQDIQLARSLVPARPEFHFALARLEPELSRQHLERALTASPRFSRARLALAVECETTGDFARAEQQLLKASQFDRGFAPAWALANYYFRRADTDRFWRWAREAAAKSYGDPAPLFDLCHHIEPATTAAGESTWELTALRTDLRQKYVRYLHSRGHLAAAFLRAGQLLQASTAADKDIVLDLVDAALAAGHIEPAFRLWSSLCATGLLRYDDCTNVANGTFRQPILNRGFDWRISGESGFTAHRSSDGSLAVSFSGKQPENFDVLHHYLYVKSHLGYRLKLEYRFVEANGETGLFWSAGDSSHLPIQPAAEWTTAEMPVDQKAAVVRLVLSHRRVPGWPRVAGTLSIRNVRLEENNARAGFSLTDVTN